MVRAHAFPFWAWNFSADAAHCSLFDVWRNPHCGAFLNGPGPDLTKIRHCPRALARDVSGFSAAARARIFALLHLASFQTDTAGRHSCARTFAGRGQTGSRPAPAGLLE